MKIQTMALLEAEMRAVVRGEIPAPPDAHLPSAEPAKLRFDLSDLIRSANA
jgi:hypothetical protein